MGGRRRFASAGALLQVLRTLDLPLRSLADVPTAILRREQAFWSRAVEPVVVVWQGSVAKVELRLPAEAANDSVLCGLELESGRHRIWNVPLDRVPIHKRAEVDGLRYVAKGVVLPKGLPVGYHRLRFELNGQRSESLLICSPQISYPGPSGFSRRQWGLFMPLYALHSQNGCGAGDLSDLGNLLRWAGKRGCKAMGTLPLLPLFLERPYDPSPYAPVSRLFWNEFWLDLARIPELRRCKAAGTLMNSARFQRETQALQQASLVDYRRQMRLKRQVLEKLAGAFFSKPSPRRDAFQRFLRLHPQLEDYSRFQAVLETTGPSWHRWPASMTGSRIRSGEYPERIARYHRYVQWLAHEQMEQLSKRAQGAGVGLYFDLPLGVHPDGYDAWREQESFAQKATAGAPPDTFFTRGQDWGFPPLHPQKIRERGYGYFIACLRHSMRYASWLRIDHVMGFHRLFWIPQGLPATEGVYVRYPAEELYGILCLESHRNRCALVGENLGTVPPEVNSALARHRWNGMFVVQYELRPDPRRPLRSVPAQSVASLNTHDMPPFAAFWGGRKRREGRLKKALLSFLRRKGWLSPFDDSAVSVTRGLHAFLSASSVRLLLVSLEDLWGEMQPHNVPGTTGRERPNWRRKARYDLESFARMPEVIRALEEIRCLRERS